MLRMRAHVPNSSGESVRVIIKVKIKPKKTPDIPTKKAIRPE